ncbi:Oxysterol-binding protein-domain-containing protein [Phakopsora pachyrhizi]|nr:Oxysterol-binding protein-domain-containing protein [Phakopsora pachyrhizi]
MGLSDWINQIKKLHKQPENACVIFNLVPNYKLHKTNEPYGTHFPIFSIFNMFKCIFDVTSAKVSSDTGDLYLLEAPSSPNCSLLPSSPLPSSSTTTISLRSQQRPSSLLMTTSSIITEDNVLAEPRRSVSTIATTIPRQSVSTRVAFLNKQVSHHPPISCFWYKSCTKASETEDFVSVAPSVIAHGVDQISAKFTGTSVKIFPGPMNKGIFVQLPNQNKEYHITHPTATISGLLRASPYAVITDHTYITCKSSGTNRYRAIISYLDKDMLNGQKEPLNPFLLQPSTSSKETFKPGGTSEDPGQTVGLDNGFKQSPEMDQYGCDSIQQTVLSQEDQKGEDLVE